MIPKEVLRQVKNIEIRTTHLVNDMFGGQYESVFKGHGIEFAEVREYTPGDDIRSIDWNVTARTGNPFVKVFTEERELTVIFAVDTSASLRFGSGEKLKSEVAAEVCALLSFAAIKNNDKIGLLIYTDEIEKYIPVKKGRKHVLRVIREVLYYQPNRKGTNTGLGLETLSRVLSHRAVIFIISDFLDENYSLSLKILARNHDVIAIRLTDPREMQLPRVGYLALADAESGKTGYVNTNDKELRKRFSLLAHKRHTEINNMFKTIGVDKIDIDVTQSYVDPIRKFFVMRERRL